MPDMYNTSYNNFAAEVLRAVAVEAYGEDIGQTGWMTATEFRHFWTLLELHPGMHVLEIGSGAGGCAVTMAAETGCEVTAIDINEHGILNGARLAEERGLSTRVRFRLCDVSRALPFPDNTFDAVFSNDAMCHLLDRAAVLREWRRVLKPGGRFLFTDAMVVTGPVTNQELATRSSIGVYLFLPPGENERLVSAAGFALLRVDDLTPRAADIAQRRRDARARHRQEMLRHGVETPENFDGVQTFLECVRKVSAERRLSRFAYLAQKPS